MIDQPGIFELSAAAYHADPVGPMPSLTSSLARILLAQSPQHCWFACPRLNPAYVREEDGKFDLGSAVHSYLLEGEANVVIVEAQDWRTTAAKDARSQARAEGKTPLLAEQWARVQVMAVAARMQLETHEARPIPLTGGQPERTLVWKEGDIWCRARLDWLHDDGQTIDDFKSTEASANPEAWTRGPLWNMGYDLQEAFYRRGLRAVTGARTEPTFRFIVQEAAPPYALSVIALGPEAQALADRKVEWAIRAWAHCLERGEWPGYPVEVCWAEPPPWEAARWLEQETHAEDDGRPLADQLWGKVER